MNLKALFPLLLTLVFTSRLCAFDEPGNLLKDFEMNSPGEIWNIQIPVQRETIESFDWPIRSAMFPDGDGRRQDRASQSNRTPGIR